MPVNFYWLWRSGKNRQPVFQILKWAATEFMATILKFPAGKAIRHQWNIFAVKLKNAERFITPELKEFEDKALSAKSRALSREKQLYSELLEILNQDLQDLQNCASAISEIDLLATLAERAHSLNFCQPELSEQPNKYTGWTPSSG